MSPSGPEQSKQLRVMDILGVIISLSSGLGVVHVCLFAKVEFELASKCVTTIQ